MGDERGDKTRAEPKRQHTLIERARDGATVGFVGAVLLSLVTVVVAILPGSDLREAYGISVFTIVLVYLVTLPLGGAMVGPISGLFRWAPGAVLLGFLAGLPAFLAFGTLMAPPEGVSRVAWLKVGGGLSLVIGGGGGLVAWLRDWGRHRRLQKAEMRRAAGEGGTVR